MPVFNSSERRHVEAWRRRSTSKPVVSSQIDLDLHNHVHQRVVHQAILTCHTHREVIHTNAFMYRMDRNKRALQDCHGETQCMVLSAQHALDRAITLEQLNSPHTMEAYNHAIGLSSGWAKEQTEVALRHRQRYALGLKQVSSSELR